MINANVHVYTEGNVKKVNLLIQYLSVNVSVLVRPCHTSVMLLVWEDPLSGLDQLLIIVTAMS